MALAIGNIKENRMASVIVDRRLWLTADKDKLVEDGDPKAAFLWANEGLEVTDEEANRVGYKPKGGKSKGGSDAGEGRPAKSASKGDWVDYAVSQGADREAAEAANKDELVDADDYTVFTAAD